MATTGPRRTDPPCPAMGFSQSPLLFINISM